MWPLRTSTTYELCSADALARLQCRFTVNPYNHIGSSVISFAAIKGLLIAFKLVRACWSWRQSSWKAWFWSLDSFYFFLWVLLRKFKYKDSIWTSLVWLYIPVISDFLCFQSWILDSWINELSLLQARLFIMNPVF